MFLTFKAKFFNLTLTSVVFEFKEVKPDVYIFDHLTLTSVVFE